MKKFDRFKEQVLAKAIARDACLQGYENAEGFARVLFRGAASLELKGNAVGIVSNWRENGEGVKVRQGAVARMVLDRNGWETSDEYVIVGKKLRIVQK